MKYDFRRRKSLDSTVDELIASSSSLSKSTAAAAMPSASIPPFVIRATSIASLGGILFGYDMGVISGALPQLIDTFSLTTNQQQLVVGILYLGGGFGAAIGGSLCDNLGRKTAILITDIVFGIGAAILYWANSIPQVVVGRIVMGFAISVSGIADVAYLHEMAPRDWRGAIVSVNEACISLGFLFAYLVGYLLSDRDDGWRAMFGLSGVVAFGQLLGMWSMPESPLWLKEKGRLEEAHDALRIIYGGDEMIPMEEAQHHVDSTKPARSSSTEHLIVDEREPSYESLPSVDEYGHPSLWGSVCYRYRRLMSILVRYRKQAWIALFLSVAQQLSGQTNVLNYAPLIFNQLNANDGMSSTLLIGIVKFVVTVLVIWKIEYLGRRFLLLVGMSVIVVGLLLMTLAFAVTSQVNEDGEVVPSKGGMYLALPGVLCVVMGYSASFGPLTWLLTSELFPTDIRGRALGVSTIITYLCACLATSTFLSAQTLLGGHVFLLYAAFTFLGVVFTYLAIPDTGGKSVSEIDDDLQCMWWWKQGSYNVVDMPVSAERPVLELT